LDCSAERLCSCVISVRRLEQVADELGTLAVEVARLFLALARLRRAEGGLHVEVFCHFQKPFRLRYAARSESTRESEASRRKAGVHNLRDDISESGPP